MQDCYTIAQNAEIVLKDKRMRKAYNIIGAEKGFPIFQEAFDHDLAKATSRMKKCRLLLDAFRSKKINLSKAGKTAISRIADKLNKYSDTSSYDDEDDGNGDNKPPANKEKRVTRKKAKEAEKEEKKKAEEAKTAAQQTPSQSPSMQFAGFPNFEQFRAMPSPFMPYYYWGPGMYGQNVSAEAAPQKEAKVEESAPASSKKKAAKDKDDSDSERSENSTVEKKRVAKAAKKSRELRSVEIEFSEDRDNSMDFTIPNDASEYSASSYSHLESPRFQSSKKMRSSYFYNGPTVCKRFTNFLSSSYVRRELGLDNVYIDNMIDKSKELKKDHLRHENNIGELITCVMDQLLTEGTQEYRVVHTNSYNHNQRLIEMLAIKLKRLSNNSAESVLSIKDYKDKHYI